MVLLWFDWEIILELTLSIGRSVIGFDGWFSTFLESISNPFAEFYSNFEVFDFLKDN